MYESFFAFSERPFSIAPDPRFLYLSERHREALAHLVYGLHDDGGFVMLTGEVGTGKTTLCRSLLAQVPEHIDVAFVLNPLLDAVELLETVCDELRIDCATARGSVKQLIDRINAHLLARNAEGRSTVLLIDEAQNLATDVLEQLRLLTNLETNERKLLRIILIGQPELAEKLARDDLRQLAQRITARYHLEALGAEDTAAYVEHRLQVAGARATVFSPTALRALHRSSGGVPRLINTIADRALLGAYGTGKREVGPEMVRKAASEVTGEPRPHKPRPWWQLGLAASALLAFGAIGAWAVLRGPAQQPELAVAAPVLAEPPSAAPPAAAPDVVEFADTTSVVAPGDEAPLVIRPDNAAPPLAATTPNTPDRNMAVRANLPPWPDYLPIEESNERAFAAVFGRWHAPYEPVALESPCDYARKVGMACMRGRSTLEGLARVDRPAVLELQDPARGTYFAALTRLDAGHAELVIAERSYRVPRNALTGHWAGDYTLLWQLPPQYRGPISVGARGPTVASLRDQLQQATGTTLPGAARERFDAALASALRRWQRSNGLPDDGSAGPLTWIALHDAIGMEAPRLGADQLPARTVARRDTTPSQSDPIRPSATRAIRRAPRVSPNAQPSLPGAQRVLPNTRRAASDAVQTIPGTNRESMPSIEVETADDIEEGHVVIGPDRESAG